MPYAERLAGSVHAALVLAAPVVAAVATRAPSFSLVLHPNGTLDVAQRVQPSMAVAKHLSSRNHVAHACTDVLWHPFFGPPGGGVSGLFSQ